VSHRRFCFLMLSLAALVPCAFAQRGGGRGAAAPAGSSAPRPVDITATRSFDMASVERGGKVFAAQCASCHGDNARGGKGTKTDMDLLRSEIVVMDHAGRELPEFLKLGRPEKNMPKFDLSHDEGVEVSAWLHYQVSLVTLWNQYTKLNIFSGDAKAGEAFFNGSVGKCGTCHSVTGGGGGNVTATVTLENGEKFTGAPAMINDFVVEIRLDNGQTKTWLRNGDWPKVTQVNRLQAHIDLMLKYTDDDIHNLAAYLNDK